MQYDAAVPEAGCDFKNGTQPSCAPLAVSYVPMQQKGAPKYTPDEALTRGTLFPGLDLPFMNVANQNNPYAGTPLGDLMSLNFVMKELNLYLDTHADDTEAFQMMKEVIALSEKCQKEYAAKYGPVMLSDLKNADHYSWLHDPWPWEYKERTGK